jgi:futalosine hydrolase
MKILIVSSTYNEASQIIERFYLQKESNNLYEGRSFDVLISGIGSVFTSFSLSQILAKKEYECVINIGIAGSYNRNINIGDTVFVVSDTFADLGIDDNGIFKTLFQENLIDENNYPFVNGKLHFSENKYKKFNKLKKVTSVTVNTTSGSANKIEQVFAKFNPDIETMEGAAVAYVSQLSNILVYQIRTISNYVEPRNKTNWNIPLAIKKLTEFVIDFIENIE